jgi:hypothetical protein
MNYRGREVKNIRIIPRGTEVGVTGQPQVIMTLPSLPALSQSLGSRCSSVSKITAEELHDRGSIPSTATIFSSSPCRHQEAHLPYHHLPIPNLSITLQT